MVDFQCTNFNDKFFLITPKNTQSYNWIVANAPQYDQGEKMGEERFACRGSDAQQAIDLIESSGFDALVQRVEPEEVNDNGN
jgi:hypothetical protein